MQALPGQCICRIARFWDQLVAIGQPAICYEMLLLQLQLCCAYVHMGRGVCTEGLVGGAGKDRGAQQAAVQMLLVLFNK
jgi:hypothetical protein